MKNARLQQLPLTQRMILERMRQAYQLTTIEQLTNRLDPASNEVLDWLRRGEIPVEHIVQCHCDTGLALDWLVQGINPNATVARSLGDIRQLTTIIENDLQQAVQNQQIEEKRKGAVADLSYKITSSLFSLKSPIIIPISDGDPTNNKH